MNEDIDVSECAFYSKGKCNNPNGMACNCCNTAICYFKELKRLEQKLKKIKETCKEAIRLCNCPDPDVNFDCVDCTDGGRASLAKKIMEVLK